MQSLRPFDLAARQVELDRAATARFPPLYDRKRARMLASPHALLRGSAPLFYEILAARPDLAAGPEGQGWIVGDMHLENVGAYRNDKDEVVFGLNDFDDAAVAPWRLDVLRLSTSVLLASRGFNVKGQAPGPAALHILGALLDSYVHAACIGQAPPPVPATVTRLIKTVSERSTKQMLDERAPDHHGKRRLERGERYLDLTPDLQAAVAGMFQAYLRGLGDRAPGHAGDWQIEDAAFRIAGTGSLGGVRIAVLVRTRSGDERLFDLKQAGPASLEALLPAAPASDNARVPSDRVVAAASAMLGSMQQLLSSIPTTPLGVSFIGRKLRPQEDKLDLSTVSSAAEIEAIARTVGCLVGAGHRRGAHSTPAAPWSDQDLAGLVDHAVELAGIFEAVYLAYARITF